jgi:hypothetical protein
VIVSSIVRFDCTAKFKKEPFALAHYATVGANTAQFDTAQSLFKVNAGQLPKDNTRLPKIVTVTPDAMTSAVVTTDFFGFDTSDNHYKLHGLGVCSEMGDAILGMVANRCPGTAMARDPQRFRPADQGRRPYAETAGSACGGHLQGLRTLEFGLQRDYLLGQYCGGVGKRALSA